MTKEVNIENSKLSPSFRKLRRIVKMHEDYPRGS